MGRDNQVMTDALEALRTALADVDNLLDHHPKSKAPQAGRPATQEGPLLRSCVLLTYAAWEVYVEDSLLWVTGKLCERESPEDIPPSLRDFVAKSASVRADPWLLAGESWRKIILDQVTILVRGAGDGTSFGMNTASPEKINSLHQKVLGSRPLNACNWQGVSNIKAKAELASFVEIRGSIAHTGKSPGALHLKGTRGWQNFISRLADRLDHELEAIL